MFSFGHFLADFLAEVDVRDALLHHEVDGADCLLDVSRRCSEEVPDSRDSIRLLRLFDIGDVVHERLYLQVLVITRVVHPFVALVRQVGTQRLVVLYLKRSTKNMKVLTFYI